MTIYDTTKNIMSLDIRNRDTVRTGTTCFSISFVLNLVGWFQCTRMVWVTAWYEMPSVSAKKRSTIQIMGYLPRMMLLFSNVVLGACIRRKSRQKSMKKSHTIIRDRINGGYNIPAFAFVAPWVCPRDQHKRELLDMFTYIPSEY